MKASRDNVCFHSRIDESNRANKIRVNQFARTAGHQPKLVHFYRLAGMGMRPFLQKFVVRDERQLTCGAQ